MRYEAKKQAGLFPIATDETYCSTYVSVKANMHIGYYVYLT